MRGYVIALSMLLLFAACEPPGKLKMDYPKFFDLKGFLNEQSLILNSLSPELRKIAFLESDIDTTIFRPDSAGWFRELAIFQELDLNKPVLRDKYTRVTKYDSVTGREVVRYELINGDVSGVQYLDIYRKSGKIDRIEGEHREKSLLYESYRRQSLSFDDDSANQKISGYSVSGWQKIILQDTVVYQVKADILY